MIGRYFSPIIFIFSISSTSLFAGIKIDGLLDEAEWDSAKSITQFYEVYRYALMKVEDIKTVVVIDVNEVGMNIGF